MLVLVLIFAVLAIVFALKTIKIVPQQMIFVVERLGKFSRSLNAGLHILIPFLDRVGYKHSLKEIVLDIPEQVCITRDNVSVGIDGVIFFQVMDAVKASYGTNNFINGIIQLAQTTLRSEIGKIDLDRTFLERENINASVVDAI